MLEAFAIWSRRRLFWVLFLSSFAFLDAVSFWITSRAPAPCVVHAISNYSDNSQKYECPSLHQFIIERMSGTLVRMGSLDTLFIIFIIGVAICLWEIIAEICGYWRFTDWFYKLDAIDKFTFALAAIGFFQLLTFEKSDETWRSSSRAFVVADELEIVPVISKDESKPEYWKVSPMLTNGGTTSTRDMHFFSGFLRDELTVAPFIKRLDPDKTEIQFSGAPGIPAALGPKARIAQATYVIDQQDVADMKAEKLALYILGAVIYRDVFNDSEIHANKFCFKLFGMIGNQGTSSLYGLNAIKLKEVDGLSARMCRYNNCADKECGPQGYHYEAIQ